MRKKKPCLSQYLDLERNEEYSNEYHDLAIKMNKLAHEMPGFISHKLFVAEDGERVVIVEFADHPSQTAWAHHPEHLEARRLGRGAYFTEYDIAVCDVVRRYKKP